MEGGKSLLITLFVIVVLLVICVAGLFMYVGSQNNTLRSDILTANQQQLDMVDKISQDIEALKTVKAQQSTDQINQSSLKSTVDANIAINSNDVATVLFTNTKGGYSFSHPSTWSAYMDNTKGSLFSKTLNRKPELGGVEVSNFNGDINAWLRYLESNSEIRFVSNSFVRVDGYDAVKVVISVSNKNTSAVYIKKGGEIFNIYINSSDKNDLIVFNEIVSSFKFSK